jgi:hypothetical protein
MRFITFNSINCKQELQGQIAWLLIYSTPGFTQFYGKKDPCDKYIISRIPGIRDYNITRVGALVVRSPSRLLTFKCTRGMSNQAVSADLWSCE